MAPDGSGADFFGGSMDISPQFTHWLFSVFSTLGLIWYLTNAFSWYFLAEKAGVRNRWMAFLPFLQFVLFFHMQDRSALNILWMLVPLVNLILLAWWTWRLLEAFGQSDGVILLVLILHLFTGIAVPVFMLYLAFSSNVVYTGSHRYH